MKFSRRGQAPRDRPEQEHEVQVFLDEARRLLDYHWRRADAFERKSLGVLGFTGVISLVSLPGRRHRRGGSDRSAPCCGPKRRVGQRVLANTP
jgi:hypothetical protein